MSGKKKATINAQPAYTGRNNAMAVATSVFSFFFLNAFRSLMVTKTRLISINKFPPSTAMRLGVMPPFGNSK